MNDSRFVYVTYIRTTPEKLWKALIDPEFTRRFWNETWQDCEWKPGATWRLMIPDGRVADARGSCRNRGATEAGAAVAERVYAGTARGRLFADDI
jgi:uncharacterized protein YndB with AHSA1/START domain